MTTKTLKKALLKKSTEPKPKLLSTGSTLLNLCCSDSIEGGFMAGLYYNLVGDSDTGKSVIGMTILAEASINPNFEDYSLVYDNAERAKLLTLDKFPKQLKERISFVESNSPEEFYYEVDDWLEKGPVVYILDSMDSLIAEAADKKFKKQKTAHRKGKQEAGSYGADKAKVNAANLNRVCSKLKKNGSILIIISQTHDSMNQMFMGPKKSRSGGHAMKFYNRGEIWLSVRETLNKSYKGKNIQIGTRTKAKVQKNHLTGKKRTAEISIYNEYGLDDSGDNVDFLIEWGHWNGKTYPEFDFSGKRDDLIKHIEEKEVRIKKLRKIVQKVWDLIESKIALNRRPKYREN